MAKTLGKAFFMLIFLISCKGSADRADTYFDSLIVSQETVLNLKHPQLTKIARLGGKKDSTTFRPRKEDWKNELDVFHQLTLFERGANQKAYRVRDGLKDQQSNLLIRQYSTTENISIPQVRFFYLGDFRRLKKIEAVYRQDNTLYQTERRLQMEFDELDGVAVLSSYHIEGFEKMIWGDTVLFSIRSTLTF